MVFWILKFHATKILPLAPKKAKSSRIFFHKKCDIFSQKVWFLWKQFDPSYPTMNNRSTKGAHQPRHDNAFVRKIRLHYGYLPEEFATMGTLQESHTLLLSMFQEAFRKKMWCPLQKAETILRPKPTTKTISPQKTCAPAVPQRLKFFFYKNYWKSIFCKKTSYLCSGKLPHHFFLFLQWILEQ